MKHTSFLFLCLIFLSACSQKDRTGNDKTAIPEPKANSIVLIFENPVKHGFSINPKTGRMGAGRTTKGDEIQFYDEHYLEERLTIDFEQSVDTVVIPTRRNVLEVRLMYNGLDDLTYYFQNGDTVRFQYQERKPVATILNRPEDSLASNYSLFLRDSIANEGMMALDIIKMPLVLLGKIKPKDNSVEAYNKAMDEYTDKVAKMLSKELNAELNFAESLKSKNLISEEVYSARILSIYMKLLGSTVYADKNKESFSKTQITNSLKNLENRYPEIVNYRNDSLFSLNEYTKTFSSQISKKAFEGVRFIEQSNGQAGFRIPNFPIAYDRMLVDSTLSETQRKITLYKYVDGILREGKILGIQTQLQYLTKFKNDVQDSVLTQKLESKYNIKYEIDDAIELEDLDGNKTSLRELIASSSTLLYIDYWASWCAPCIKEMPSSASIRAQLSEQPISFIYISTDNEKENWMKAIDKHQLNGIHYRITNGRNSKGLEDLNIPFIPRYMIYNNGQLVNNDAPRPSEKDRLIEEFNRYLGNQ